MRASIACASALTELVTGKSIAEARALLRERLIDSVEACLKDRPRRAACT